MATPDDELLTYDIIVWNIGICHKQERGLPMEVHVIYICHLHFVVTNHLCTFIVLRNINLKIHVVVHNLTLISGACTGNHFFKLFVADSLLTWFWEAFTGKAVISRVVLIGGRVGGSKRDPVRKRHQSPSSSHMSNKSPHQSQITTEDEDNI